MSHTPVITESSASRLILPLVEPFKVATRTAHEAENVLLRIATDTGAIGLGAAAPVAYVTGETIDSVMTALSEAAPGIIDLPTDRLAPLLERATELIPGQAAARAALEMALYDLWAKHWKLPLWQHFAGARTSIVTDLTIPLVQPDDAARKAREAWSNGFRHLKVKVGDPGGIDVDKARLRAVASAAPGAAVRIDANQAFSPEEAVKFIKSALEISTMIELVEQPVAKYDFAGLAYVRAQFGGSPPIFADESAHCAEAAAELIHMRAVDGVNVKLMKSGMRGVLEIASLCRANGIKLMIGCMLESRLSLTAACAIAAGTGWFDHVDIDSHLLVRPSDALRGGFTDAKNRLSPEAFAPGWGVSLPDAEGNIPTAQSVDTMD
jgi:L-alanine-DL-glutamate epimerase-like enolase superfamily enzyme